jgi:hypothetical protein
LSWHEFDWRRKDKKGQQAPEKIGFGDGNGAGARRGE